MTILCTLLEIIILVGCLYGIVVWLRFTPKVWKGYGFFDRLYLIILLMVYVIVIIKVILLWR